MSQIQHKHLSPQKQRQPRQSTYLQTFSSSIIDKPQKFSLDKTLVKGIKQNDPSHIVQNGQQADLGHTADLYDQEKQVNQILIDMRKKYDRAKQTTTKIQQTIERLKKEKQNLQAQKQKIEEIFKNEQNQYKKLQAEIERFNSNCESAQYDKDIRLQMSQTLKQDILFYKKNCFEANIKIVRNCNKVKTLTCQLQNTSKVSKNCKTLIHSIDKKINLKQAERYEKINSYYEILNKKIENNQKRQERQKMIQNSMLEALYGKMPQQQQQKKVLLVNLALKKIFKYKMERQMEKFNQIESAFRNIQQNTSVKKAQQFIQRFIKREKTYGQLLESINKSQQKITKLKRQKQILQKQHYTIMHDKQTIEDLQLEKKGQEKSQSSVSIDLLREKLLHNERLKNKTFNLAAKFLAGFDGKNANNIKQRISRDKPNRSLKQILEKVNKFLDSLEKEQVQLKLNQIYIESKDLSLPSAAKTRNLRIKTLTTRQDTQNSVMEDHDIAYDDFSQREFLNHNRKQVKKSAYLKNRLKTKAY